MVYVPKVSSGVASVGMPTSYPTRVVAGHTMVDLPGGCFVQGSAKYPNTMPRWTCLSSFSAGVTPVSEMQYRPVMGAKGLHGGNWTSGPNATATRVSWDQAVQYCDAVNAAQRTQVGLLTRAEGEYAGRGPVVNLRAVMAAEGIAPENFARFVADRYENFVPAIEPGARIFTDANDTTLQKLLHTDAPLYAWCMYAPAHRPRNRSWDTDWFELDDLFPVDWGTANGFGVKLVPRGFWEWRADTPKPEVHDALSHEEPAYLLRDTRARIIVRGGAQIFDDRNFIRLVDLGFRHRVYPETKYGLVGFRVGTRPGTPPAES